MAKEKVVLLWTNKWSGEQGFVGKISEKDGHFTNATSKEEVHRYPNNGLASAAIKKLERIGEAENNNFTIVPESAVGNFKWPGETNFFK